MTDLEKAKESAEKYARGYALAQKLNPDMEDVLEARYSHLLPGMAQTVTGYAYGAFYAREGLDLKTRYAATIAALTALGGQTAPQLRINIAAGRAVGLSQAEIAEIVWQMALYGGLPAAINALNTALEVFSEEEMEGLEEL